MNKFDEVISTKLGQLNEVITPAGTAQPGATPGSAPVVTPSTQPTTSQATPQPAQAQPAQAESPEQALTKIFQTLKFSDPNTAVKTLNTALKGAGKVPGINEFFGSLGYDQNGFKVVQQTPAAQAPAAQAPGTTPLK
jgi:hypothetical protein